MILLIDSDVVFDVYQRRQPHYKASNAVMKLAKRGVVSGAVAAHTLANLVYFHDRPAVPFIADSILPHFAVVCGDAQQTGVAMRAGMKDFEDVLQAAAALGCKAAFIISRNLRHFRKSPVPAIAPDDWFSRFSPEVTA